MKPQKKPTQKQLAENFILNLEADLKDIKRHVQHWNYDLTVDKIRYLLTLTYRKWTELLSDNQKQPWTTKNC